MGETILRAQQRAANTTAAVNSVAKALDQQIKRNKSHAYRSERKRQASRSEIQETEAWNVEPSGLESDSRPVIWADVGSANRQVVRVKQFEMEPMSVGEAATQMLFLDHSFYMFLDYESNKLGVLYLAGDGNHGLIQPESVKLT